MMDDSESADGIVRRVAEIEADIAYEAEISEEMERRDAERNAQRLAKEKQYREDRDRHRAENAELIEQLTAAADKLRSRRRRLGYMAIGITLIAGLILVWSSTMLFAAGSFFSKLAEILGGAMLVATTIEAGARIVSDVLNDEERELQRRESRQLERILRILNELKFRNLLADLHEVAAELADKDRQRARWQVRVNRLDSQSEHSESDRRVREVYQSMINSLDREIERLTSSDS